MEWSTLQIPNIAVLISELDSRVQNPALLVETYLPRILAELILREYQHDIEKAKAGFRFPEQMNPSQDTGGKAPAPGMQQWRNHLQTCCGSICNCGAYR